MEIKITTDKSVIDHEVVYGFLSQSYWARGIPKETYLKTLENSLCFSLFLNKKQVGFARIISDKASFAYLCDVFVLEEHRHKGLATKLTQHILNYPELQGLRRWLLATLDAHELYRKNGFTILENPERFMQIHNPSAYGIKNPC